MQSEAQPLSAKLAYTFSEILDIRLGASTTGDKPQDWIKQMLTTPSNKEHKEILTGTDNIVRKVNELAKSKGQDIQLDDFEELFKNMCTEYDVEVLICTLFAVFLKENQLGQSVYHQYVEDLKCPVDHNGPLIEFEFDPISIKNKKLQGLLGERYAIESETFYCRVQFLVLMYGLEIAIEYSLEKGQLDTAHLWKARFSFMHNDMLTSNAEQLCNSCLESFEKYIGYYRSLQDQASEDEIPMFRKNLAMLLSEQSFALIQFWKYEKCLEAVEEALELLGIDLNLDGKMGRRTKWQSFDLAQLVLDVKLKEVAVTAKPMLPAATENGDNGKSELYVTQDDESILLEQPNLTTGDDTVAPADLSKLESKELMNEQKIAIQAYVNFIFKTAAAKDDMIFEVIRSYVNVCVTKSTNWLTYAKALLLRSKNEVNRHKHMERSLAQVQALIDQFRDQKILGLQKIDFSFASSYPMNWGVKLELAQNYQQVGIYMSAYELVKAIAMDEEAVKCLFMAGRQTEAIKQAEELMAGEGMSNYNLMCLLGEMKRDHTWFQRAWDESEGKCAKAMRNLGRYYFFENKFQESADCFEKGLKLNKLYPDTWFTMGCAYMRLENFKAAVYAFGTVVSIDERQDQAWANLSNCYAVTGRPFQAVTCSEQALRCNKKAWKIWKNYVQFSLDTLQFYKATNGIRHLLRYDQLEHLNSQLMARVCKCFIDKFVKNEVHKDDPDADEQSAEPQSQQDFDRHKKQLYQFFKQYTEKINDYKVWRLVGRVKESLQEPMEEVKELKFKEIRAIMKVNWHVYIETCELVEKTMQELVSNIFSKIEPSEEEKAFVRNTAKAIAEGTQRPCTVQI